MKLKLLVLLLTLIGAQNANAENVKLGDIEMHAGLPRRYVLDLGLCIPASEVWLKVTRGGAHIGRYYIEDSSNDRQLIPVIRAQISANVFPKTPEVNVSTQDKCIERVEIEGFGMLGHLTGGEATVEVYADVDLIRLLWILENI